jgi:hypothetical protein
VLELKENAVTVKFENIVTDVKKEFLSVYSCVNDRVVASRLQIPLVLSFGITIHKSQGLTLDRVEVHCEGIFKAGMLGVAIGRARKKKGLKDNCVIKPEKAVSELYMEPTIPFTENLDLLECCKISISLESDLFDNFEDTASEAEMSE